MLVDRHVVGQFGLQVCNALVQEPIVVPGTGESFFQSAVVLAQLPYSGRQCVGLGEESLDAVSR